MIDNNIIQSIGAGSGIDTNNLVKQLTSIEKAAPQNRIDKTRDLTESKISDFGKLKSALSTLKDAAETLTDPEGLFSKTASFTESDALVPVELGTDVQTGSYTFEVNAIAKSQSLSSTSFTSITDTVGEGTLTIRLGSVTTDVNGAMTAFTADVEEDAIEIVIDSTNNSLSGLRDAINNSDSGIQASIVNDGSGYKLQIKAASGAANELEITVAESGGTPTNEDASGLSRFAFNTTVSQLTENQGGQDASLTLNGLAITRETNKVEDVVEGLTLDILKAAPGEEINITISDDKAFAEQNIRDFVEAYNLFLEAIEPIFGTSEVEGEEGETTTVTGSLAKDSLAKSILSQIRSTIASSIPGLGNSDFTSLTNIGIRTELDGTLSIDEDDFSDAFDTNFEDIQKLFAPTTYSSSGEIFINSYGKNTTAGEYEVDITTAPDQGYYNGGDIDDTEATFPNFDSSAKTYDFKISVNGNTSDTLVIPSAVYADKDEMAVALQTLINADETLAANAATVTVTYDSTNDRFDITSNKYGASSTVEITEASASASSDLGLAVASGTAGVTVAGTIDGVAGFASGNVLLPQLGEPAEGLALVIGKDASSGTVNFSRGFAGELSELITSFLTAGGVIDLREDSLESDLDDLDEDQTSLDRRMTAYQERLIQQFISMERILNSLNSSGSFLDNLVNTLPFTAKRD